MSAHSRTAALFLVIWTVAGGAASAQRLRQSISPAPVAPSGITATAAAPAGVTVTWQPSFGAAQYQLVRTADPAVPGTAIGAPTPGTSVTDPSPLSSAAYYQVIAIAADGRQAASPLVSYSPPPPPAQIATPMPSYATRLTATTPAFTGAPPVRLAVSSFNPGFHRMTWDWDGVHGVSYYQVYLQSLPSTGWQLLRDQHTYKSYDHMDFIAPATATFRVVAVYPDGTKGMAEIGYPNPPQPAPPAGLTAAQLSAGALRFSWQQAPGATGYRLTGPAIPSPGLTVGITTTALVTGIPVGTHQYAIASLYQNGKSSAPATAMATVRSTIGTYRVTINGFLTQTPSADDPLSFDGKGDEIFLAAYWAAYPYKDRNLRSSGFVQSRTYGDANQAPLRIQAGSVSGMGGIGTGDIVPAGYAPIPQPGVAAYPDRLPLLVWQGALSDSGDVIGIHPAIWEADRNPTPNWATWKSWFTTPNGRGGFVDAVQLNSGPGPIKPVAVFNWSEDFPLAPAFNVGQGADRPIGIARRPGMPNENSFGMAGVVLTRERIEAALGASSAIVVPFLYYDRLELGGAYRLFLQIERLP